MKILHIIETLNLGGAENFVADLSNNMVSAHTVVICCIKERGVTVKKISPGVLIDCLEKKEGNVSNFIFHLFKYIREAKPDVVHLHSLGVILELSLVMVFFHKPKYVVTCHGHLSHYSNNRFKLFVRRLLEIPAFMSVDKIVVVSNELKKILPWPISKKVYTLLNGVSVGDNPVIPVHKKDVVDLIYAGRLAKIKNIDCVIRAIKQIEDNIKVKLKFRILGEGPEMGPLKDLVRDLNVKTEINFIGYVSDVRSWYRDSDIFILPSSYEGISIALLEAMAEALAVIVTNVGGNLEIVTNDATGVVVEANDVSALAAAITKLACEDNFRRHLQLSGFDTVKKRFNLEAVTCRYVQLYQD